MSVKKGDFIEIDYTGKVVGDDIVFDTTEAEVAKANGLHNESAIYQPITVCVGKGHVLKGLDASLEGKEAGKEFTVNIPPEDGFGRKNAKLLRLIPAHVFKKQQTVPQLGMQVNIDGLFGVVRSVTGGRVIVDFNHPLASKELEYKVKIIKQVTDTKDKVQATLKMKLGIEDFTVAVKEEKAIASVTQDIPEDIQNAVKEEVKETCGVELDFVKKAKSDSPDKVN